MPDRSKQDIATYAHALARLGLECSKENLWNSSIADDTRFLV